MNDDDDILARVARGERMSAILSSDPARNPHLPTRAEFAERLLRDEPLRQRYVEAVRRAASPNE